MGEKIKCIRIAEFAAKPRDRLSTLECESYPGDKYPAGRPYIVGVSLGTTQLTTSSKGFISEDCGYAPEQSEQMMRDIIDNTIEKWHINAITHSTPYQLLKNLRNLFCIYLTLESRKN